MSSSPTPTPTGTTNPESRPSYWYGFLSLVVAVGFIFIFLCVVGYCHRRNKLRRAKEQNVRQLADGLEAYEVGRRMQNLKADEMGFEMVDLEVGGAAGTGKGKGEGKGKELKGDEIQPPSKAYMGGKVI